MTDSSAELLSQLNMLLRLTQTEEMIAQVRRTQATSDVTKRELAENADKCRERSQLLRGLISDLGGIPDVVGAAMGRLSATAKTQLEQGTTLSEALLSDLSLEHQLFDRAHFVKMLARKADEPKVVQVMERLETAHAATIEWINTILAEVAVGGPTKLRPTTAQAAVATGRRLAFFGANRAAIAVNRSVAAFGAVQHRFSRTTTDAADKIARLSRDTSEVVAAGRDAALSRAEEVAREEGADRTVQLVRETRESLGALHADELPINGYDALNAGMASARIEKLGDAHDVEVVLTYERANKNRASVIRAAETRTEELAHELADSPS